MGCCGGHRNFNHSGQQEDHGDQRQDGNNPHNCGNGIKNLIWIGIGVAVVVLFILTR